MRNLIAVEEHFATRGFEEYIWERDTGDGAQAFVDHRGAFLRQLESIGGVRLDEMNALGVRIQALSFTAPGIQEIVSAAEAARIARAVNNDVAQHIAECPNRFFGLAALPMQDPTAAAAELTRAVTELGFRGALVNGASNAPDGNGAIYYDGPEYLNFWRTVADLEVPLYLHPRNPVPSHLGPFKGRPELLGPTWAFAVETGTHALRLVTSGLFDRVPSLTIILGHLGEFLPFAIERLQQRLAYYPWVSLERSPREVLNRNFYVTVSGNYHTPSLLGVLLQMGADRVLFASDYPFERMADAVNWFSSVPISEADREKIAHGNAERLFGLPPATKEPDSVEPAQAGQPARSAPLPGSRS
jgi:gamma-resorcylate decarboxylase